MKTAEAVIGANFGDEGKGLMTDYLCSITDADVVVRYNGGSQAGHTVVTPKGRHVFNHVGSGTLLGVPTFLSRFFIVNPLVFFKEQKQLNELMPDKRPPIYVDRDCIVTTPFDMFLNQILERRRDANMHGSCGLGINETIVRSQIAEYRLTADQLQRHDTRDILKKIRDFYVPRRLQELGIKLHDVEQKLLETPNFIDKFADDCYEFAYSIAYIVNPDFIKVFNRIVFEGAQGLLLDQDHRYFPHVTHSKTGIKNVLALAEQAGVEELNANYITRSYLTRHGAGPLPFELKEPPFKNIKDETNIHNPYQGTLRFAQLDCKSMVEEIINDLKPAKFYTIKVNASISMTCIDQVGDEDQLTKIANSLIDTLQDSRWIKLRYVSAGPTRADISPANLLL